MIINSDQDAAFGLILFSKTSDAPVSNANVFAFASVAKAALCAFFAGD